MKINIVNFNSFTLIVIIDKINSFIEDNHIARENIICFTCCPNGSINLYYWD